MKKKIKKLLLFESDMKRCYVFEIGKLCKLPWDFPIKGTEVCCNISARKPQYCITILDIGFNNHRFKMNLHQGFARYIEYILDDGRVKKQFFYNENDNRDVLLKAFEENGIRI